MRRLFMNAGIPWPLQEKEGEGGGGGGGKDVDVEATVRRLLSEKGSSEAVSELLRDNFKQREELRDLKRELKGKVPEGGLVLDATQAAAWKQYQELGKPEDLKKSIETKVELEAKEKRRERAEQIAEAADAHGFRPEVLVRLVGDEELRIDLKEEVVEGEKVKVAYVTPAGDGATPMKLDDYADQKWKEFMPALTAEAADGEDRSDADDSPPARTITKQSPRGRQPKKGAASVEKARETKVGRRRYIGL